VAIDSHFFGDRRCTVLTDVPLMLQMNGHILRKIVLDQIGWL
jgi:hypothetical protein